MKLTERTLEQIKLPDDKIQLFVWDEELPGFGVVIGKTVVTFVANFRALDPARGRKVERRQVIGRRGQPRPDGHLWNVTLARQRARELLGQVAGGGDPSATARALHGGPTLGEAFALHISGMRKEEASPSSLATIERERDKYLKEWLERPLRQIERESCLKIHTHLTEEHGPYLANRVMRHVRASWNTALRVFKDLPANPCIAVTWNKEHRRQEPIPWAKLPAWYETVLQLDKFTKFGVTTRRPGVRGDYQLTMLFTGLRRMDAATIRKEHLNLSKEPKASRTWNVARARWKDIEIKPYSLFRPNPKGGAERAFSIPLSTESVKIFERRIRENAVLFGDRDGGWLFPTYALKSKPCVLCAALGVPAHEAGAVIHVVEGKEQRIDRATGESKRLLPSPHRLRDTYTTACEEAGLSGYMIDVLTNHRPARGTVTAGYIEHSDEHLAECQERATQYLLSRLNPTAPSNKRTRRS